MNQQISTASLLASLPKSKQQLLLDSLTEKQRAFLKYEWKFWARPSQLEPAGDWTYWLVMAGRGYGKTRIGAEWVRYVKNFSPRIALIGETAADVRDVMIEGDSGILATSPPWDRPLYQPSKRQLTWPNGAIAKTYSGQDPDQLRGPQQHAAWCDELAKYRYAQEVWDQLNFGLRLGEKPRALVTTTPRPVPVIRDLLDDPATHVTRGSTYDNQANLAGRFFTAIIGKYEGTRLGRQELLAEILDDLPGALWTRSLIEQAFVKPEDVPQMQRIVIGVDPSGTSEESGNKQGIITAGHGVDGKFYVMEDASCSLSPAGWAKMAVGQYHKHAADLIVAERNYGGEMVESVIRNVDPNVPVKMVTASRGKFLRAEPIAGLYEQGRVKHVGAFSELEEEMTNITPQGYEGRGSPDRLDAMVWALTELSGGTSLDIIGLF